MTDEYKFLITGKDQTKRAFKSIRQNLTGVRAGINSTQVKMGVLVGAAGLGALVAKSLRTGDALAKLSDRLGATTEGLVGLQLITELNGGSTDDLTKGLERMSRGIGEAGRGVGTAKLALEDLGIGLEEIEGLSADEQFIKIGAAIGEVTDKNLQASLAADIFGRSAGKLVNTFNQGEDAMRAAREEAERLGIAMSRTDAAKLEAANDAMLKASKRIEGLGNTVTIALAPIIAALADEFTSVEVTSEEMTSTIEKGVRAGATGFGVLADGIHGVNIIVKALELSAKGLSTTFIGFVDVSTTAFFEFANTIKGALILPLKGFLELAALIPGVSDQANMALQSIEKTLANEWTPPEALHGTFLAMVDGLRETKAELHSLMMEDLPSALIDAKLTEILAKAQVKAEEIANSVSVPDGGASVGGMDKETEVEKERTAAKLERLNETYFTEREMLQKKYADEQLLLQESLQVNALTQSQFDKYSVRAAKKNAKELSDLDQKSAAAKTATMFSSMTSVTSAFAGGSKKMFTLQKNLALAETAVTLPSAIVSSYKNAGGFPFGIPAALGMAAAGLKQIAGIKSASLGGGGGTPAVGGGGGGGMNVPSFSGGAGGAGVFNNLPGMGNAANDAPRATEVHLHFNGNVGLGQDAEQNLAELKRLIVEEDFELIPSGSRNGIDLAAQSAA